MSKLYNKNVIVTGGAMGIGLATCRRLVKEGCRVTIWDLNSEAMNEAADELKQMGGEVFTHLCDVSDRERVRELILQAKNEMGPIDILINNAAFVRDGFFLERPVDDAVKQMEINVNALFYAIHEILPGMLQRDEGHIVNVSSGVAIASAPGLAAYTTSKWAVWGMTDVLRLECLTAGKKGIHFTSVHPGNVKTGMFEGFELNWIGKILSPTVKNHDVIAKGIVESGLKKNHTGYAVHVLSML